MRTLSMAFAASLILSTSGAALAQEGTDAMLAAGARFEAEQAQAQADAVHPGDELLTCEQIEAEMGATMNTPEMQAQTAEMGASTQRQLAIGEEANERARGMVTTNIVTGIIGSFIPGAGYAQGAAMQAQAAQQQATATESQREMAGMIGNMSNMMPTMMRGQRLYELAQAQECAFLQDMPQSER